MAAEASRTTIGLSELQTMTRPRPADWITQKTLRSAAIMSIRPAMTRPSRSSTLTASWRDSLDQSGTGEGGRRVRWLAGFVECRRMFLVQGLERAASVAFII